MDSIVRNVKEIDADHRHWLEEAIGHPLEDDQQVLIRILTPGVSPEAEAKERALANLRRLSEQGARHRESLGISEAEADAVLDDAMDHIRPREG